PVIAGMVRIPPKVRAAVHAPDSGMHWNHTFLQRPASDVSHEVFVIARLRLDCVHALTSTDCGREYAACVSNVRPDVDYIASREQFRMFLRQTVVGVFHVAFVEKEGARVQTCSDRLL